MLLKSDSISSLICKLLPIWFQVLSSIITIHDHRVIIVILNSSIQTDSFMMLSCFCLFINLLSECIIGLQWL